MANADFGDEAAKQVSKLLQSVQCLKCMNPYANPEKNVCGHSFCKVCWRGQKTCLKCNVKVEYLKANRPLALRAVHLKKLEVAFEKTFGREVDFPQNASQSSEIVPVNPVEKWLVSSQNHFSAPSDSPDFIGRNAKPKKNLVQNTTKVIAQIQDDWDIIEVMPETEIAENTEKVLTKEKENIVGPMDIEPYAIDSEDYNTYHPRRSSRHKGSDEIDKMTKNTKTRTASKTIVKPQEENSEFQSAVQINVQKSKNRENVKKIRKQFKNLKKSDVKKLNVSIEMCRKTQSIISKGSTKIGNGPVGNSSLVIEEVSTPVPKAVAEAEITKKIDTTSKTQDNLNCNNSYISQKSNVMSNKNRKTSSHHKKAVVTEIIDLETQNSDLRSENCNTNELPEVNISSNINLHDSEANFNVDIEQTKLPIFIEKSQILNSSSRSCPNKNVTQVRSHTSSSIPKSKDTHEKLNSCDHLEYPETRNPVNLVINNASSSTFMNNKSKEEVELLNNANPHTIMSNNKSDKEMDKLLNNASFHTNMSNKTSEKEIGTILNNASSGTNKRNNQSGKQFEVLNNASPHTHVSNDKSDKDVSKLLNNASFHSISISKSEKEARQTTPFLIKGKLFNKSLSQHRKVPFYNKSASASSHLSDSTKDDEIQITIKTASTSTSITVTNRGGCLQLSETKIDRAAQTNNNTLPSIVLNTSQFTKEISVNTSLNKSTSTDDKIEKEKVNVESEEKTSKRGTATADTVSATYKITESVENEMGKEMNYADDVDIFNSGAVAEANDENESEKTDLNRTSSEIISCLTKEKSRKRDRNEHLQESRKKMKPSISEENEALSACDKKSAVIEKSNENDNGSLNRNNSEITNYDELVGEVFANIDAEIDECSQVKTLKRKSISQNINRTQTPIEVATRQKSDMGTYLKPNNDSIKACEKKILPEEASPHIEVLKNRTINPKFGENKYSENLFSMFDKNTQNSTKDMEIEPVIETAPIYGTSTQENLANLLTPQMCENFVENDKDFTEDGLDQELRNVFTPKTPNAAHDDSDSSSIVEETPQKIKFTSVQNSKQTSLKDKTLDSKNEAIATIRPKRSLISQEIVNIINATGSTQATGLEKPSETVTDLVESMAVQGVVETPLTIKRFSDQVLHKSTPMQPFAKKSLNFTRKSTQIDDNTEGENLCCTDEGNITSPGKTSVDRILMDKAFEKTPVPIRKQLSIKSLRKTPPKQFCISCSCLQPEQTIQVKSWCRDNNWTYVDKYTPNLTHLIVGVDENNAAQRSVKFMNALAAGKWIISYNWVMECLKQNKTVAEEPFEVLDHTGARGPFLSRTATKKLFTGMTFYCLPPFSVLQKSDLEQMLTAAGGKVTQNVKDIAYTESKGVSLLLAEMEHTQEDKFMFMPHQHKIVPVNFEWALNCLGAYQLLSIKELLLCPESLIPALPWPAELLESSCDEGSQG